MNFSHDIDPVTSGMITALLVQTLEKVWSRLPVEDRRVLYDEIDAAISVTAKANQGSQAAIAGVETVRGIIQRLG